MPLIHIGVGGPPCQVDDFPATVGQDQRPFERSCRGALHLQPASTKEITDDELNHIRLRKNHQALATRIRVISVAKKPTVRGTPKPPVRAQPEVSTGTEKKKPSK